MGFKKWGDLVFTLPRLGGIISNRKRDFNNRRVYSSGNNIRPRRLGKFQTIIDIIIFNLDGFKVFPITINKLLLAWLLFIMIISVYKLIFFVIK